MKETWFYVFDSKNNIIKISISIVTPAVAKKQCFVHLSFNSTLQLINHISSDLQKLLKYFFGTAIMAFFRIFLLFGAGWASVSPTNLALYIKDLKTTSPISALKLVGSFLE